MESLSSPKRKGFVFGPIALAIVAFFWISGGIYGNEEMMQITTARDGLTALLVAPIFYSLPIMLITAELATALPFEGGSVAWITEACGHRIGCHNKYWLWLSYVIDSSLYPRFAAYYLAKATHQGEFMTAIFAMITVAVVNVVKLIGTDVTVNLTTLLYVLTVVPSFLFLCFGFSHIRTDVITETNNGPATNWDQLLSWMLWLYSGVLSMGSVASEVDNPTRSYLIAGGILLFLDVLLINFTPLWISLSVDPNRDNYESGHFGTVAEDIAGYWLLILLTIGAQVSQIGMYNAGSIASDRYLSSFFFNPLDPVDKVPELPASLQFLHRPWRFLMTRDKAGVAPIFIFFNSSVVMGLVWLPIMETLAASIAVVSLSILFMLYSFIHLRVRRPDIQRPWKLPGGLPVAFLVATPCALLSILNIVLGFAFSDDAVFYTIAPKAIFLVLAVSLGLMVDFGHQYWTHRKTLGSLINASKRQPGYGTIDIHIGDKAGLPILRRETGSASESRSASGSDSENNMATTTSERE